MGRMKEELEKRLDENKYELWHALTMLVATNQEQGVESTSLDYAELVLRRINEII